MSAPELKPVVLWDEVPETIEKWAEACRQPAEDLRRSLIGLRTTSDVSVYWNPIEKRAGVYGRLSGFHPGELERVEQCVSSVSSPTRLTLEQLNYGPWVKVAFSRPARNLGEQLNFFPGQYIGGLPNSPSPLAATLTGGLLGAGIGYGAGKLGEQLLPKSFDRGKLSRTMAMLGGAAGASPGALWGVSNMARGRSLTDGEDFDAPLQSAGRVDAQDMAPIKMSLYDETAADLCKVAFATFGSPYAPQTPHPSAVNTNQLGQVLWRAGADGQLQTSAMATLNAASRMPDPSAQPGYVTPHQTGLLGIAMGAAGGGLGGYIAGHAVGKTLGALTGLPASAQNTLARTGLAVGVVRGVLPKLFR